MKIWFTAIAILSVVAVASAGTLTSDMSGSKGGDKGHGGKGHGGKECVPEPLTMLALAPGAAMLLRRRNKKA